MITIFRRKMKKLNKLLWLVLLSMVVASLSMIFFRQPSRKDIEVGHVNNLPIYLDEYQQEVAQVQIQIEMIKNYAQTQGISGDFFLSLYGLNNPTEVAFKEIATSKLLNQIHENIGIELDQKHFVELLGKSVPTQLFDRTGRINEEHFREYLSRMYMTISEYEMKKENEIKRDMVKTFIKNSVYIPRYSLENKYVQENSNKSFFILTIPFAKFFEEVRKEKPSEEALREFFQQRKDFYREPEKRQAEYWILSPDDYEKIVIVDERSIETFYEKNKSSLFRISPEVKVRKILFSLKKDSPQNLIDLARARATKVYNEVKEEPDKFVEFAKKYSEDKKTASKGGLVDFFKRGTYEKNFEREAFRLQEKGAITEVFQTEDGFEILQLEERKSAQYKPLDSVRDEIIKKLKEKKAVYTLKGDLEAVIYKAKTDKSVIEKFVKNKDIKGEETKLLSAKNMKGYDLVSLITKNLFAKKNTRQNFGYFTSKNQYILYREKNRENSFIPQFKDVQEKVLEEYYNHRALESQKFIMRNIRKDILEGKATLSDMQKLHNLKLVTTKMIRRDAGNIEAIDFENLSVKVFELTDKSQILKLKHDKDYYLVQLGNVEVFDSVDLEGNLRELILSEKSSKEAFCVGTFIASLVRNAKIEKNEEVLNLR